MLNFEKEQKVVEIGISHIGGQPGENSVAMIATVFYTNHAALLDEKTGKIDKKLVEQELNDYSEVIDIDLSSVEPLVAQPDSPGNVCTVKELAGKKVNQVIIGSCTNSSYLDLATVAAILKGKSVHPETSLVIAPGSRQVLAALAESGELNDIIKACFWMHGFSFQDSCHSGQVHVGRIGATPYYHLIQFQPGDLSHGTDLVRHVRLGHHGFQFIKLYRQNLSIRCIRVCRKRPEVLFFSL